LGQTSPAVHNDPFPCNSDDHAPGRALEAGRYHLALPVSPPMKLWFETHSTSIHNEQGIASGHLDPPLSEKGCLQAAQLGERYSELPLFLVYSSDLRRASLTADIAFSVRELPRRVDRRLRECDYGAWSGCPVRQLDATRLRFVDEAFPGGESFRDVVRRVEAFLTDLARENEPVLIIGHRATWYAIEHLLGGKDLRQLVVSSWVWQPGWEYEQ
jgi:broad specificity phosphatase PhoE